MYRVVTLLALEAEVDLGDEPALQRLAESNAYRLDPGPTHIRVTVGDRDVTEEIRSMRVSEHTRFIAASPAVRTVLVRKQRELGVRLGSIVTEGRDQGSVAFPHADVKFFLTADVAHRAERRYHELIAEGEDVTQEEVLRNVQERDQTDTARSVAPLVRPDGAIEIDTSRLSIQQVLEEMLHSLHDAGLVNADQLNDDHSAANAGRIGD